MHSLDFQLQIEQVQQHQLQSGDEESSAEAVVEVVQVAKRQEEGQQLQQMRLQSL